MSDGLKFATLLSWILIIIAFVAFCGDLKKYRENISSLRPFTLDEVEYQCGKTEKQIKIDGLLQEIKEIQKGNGKPLKK